MSPVPQAQTAVGVRLLPWPKRFDVAVLGFLAQLIAYCDRVNISVAAPMTSRQAMTAALQHLRVVPDYLLIDAMQLDVFIEQKSLIKGDARSVSIAAASILAKTHRDARMEEWDAIYPQYGLARHKGYATRDHLQALRQHGPSPLHRHSFTPVRDCTCWAAGATQTLLPLEI